MHAPESRALLHCQVIDSHQLQWLYWPDVACCARTYVVSANECSNAHQLQSTISYEQFQLPYPSLKSHAVDICKYMTEGIISLSHDIMIMRLRREGMGNVQ